VAEAEEQQVLRAINPTEPARPTTQGQGACRLTQQYLYRIARQMQAKAREFGGERAIG